MNITVFGGFGKRLLASGWTRETAFALLGGGEFDLSGVQPGYDAQLTAIAILGGIDIIVDEGTQITMSGFSLFGGRDVAITPGDGPSVRIRAFALFGGVEVKPPNR